MEKTVSEFYEHGDPGRGLAMLAQDIRPESQLGSFLRWREQRLSGEQRACQASTAFRSSS